MGKIFDQVKSELMKSRQMNANQSQYNQQPRTTFSSQQLPPDLPPLPQQKASTKPKDSEDVYNNVIERLIEAALADGQLTEKEKQILFKKAQGLGIDLDEFEMVLDAKLFEKKKAMAKEVNQNTSAPQSTKYGDVKKCPACGAMIKAFVVSCPDCGYEFRGIEGNCNIRELMNALARIDSTKRVFVEKEKTGFFSHLDTSAMNNNIHEERRIAEQKVTLISTYPIPLTKEDIIEFLTTAAPLSKSGITATDVDKAWRNKCRQIIEKAHFAFMDDKETLAKIDAIDEKYGISKSKKKGLFNR